MESRPGILILTAIATEFRHVGRACIPDFRDDTIVRPREPVEASSNCSVSIQKIGIRAIGLPTIEVPTDCKLIMMAGLAGGLDPALRIGEVVIAGAPTWLKIPAGLRQCEIATTDRPVTTTAAKADLFAKTGAAAVDMETAIVRDWAKSKGIDFVAIRSISDTAGDAIDPRVMNLIDAYGRTRPTHVGSYLLGNPLRLRNLLRLGRNSNLAARNLGIAVRKLIELLPDGNGDRGAASL